MAKFVLANRRAGMFTADRKKASREAAEKALSAIHPNAKVLGVNHPANDEARRVAVFEAEPHEVVREAARFGADVLVEPDKLRSAAVGLAREIAENAPLAVLSTRATLRRGLAEAVKEQTDHEFVEQARLMRTEDHKEGIKAVAERRVGNFVGR